MTPPRPHFLLDQLERLRSWFEDLPTVEKFLAAAAALVAAVVLMHFLAAGLVLLFVGIALLLALAWFEDVVWLMQQPDSVFPGRYDKVIWAALLIFLPPFGMLALWSCRRKTQEATTKAAQASWRDWM
jgi:hypothetical protein